MQVINIQSRLFDVGSAVATPLDSASEAKRTRTQFDEAETSKVEGWIDELDEQLPPLTNFILPSGLSLAVGASESARPGRPTCIQLAGMAMGCAVNC